MSFDFQLHSVGVKHNKRLDSAILDRADHLACQFLEVEGIEVTLSKAEDGGAPQVHVHVNAEGPNYDATVAGPAIEHALDGAFRAIRQELVKHGIQQQAEHSKFLLLPMAF